MEHQQLLDYVKQQRENGASDERIRAALLEAGWNETTVNDALTVVTGAALNRAAKLAGPGELLAKAWDMYRARAATLIGIAVVQYAAAALAAGFVFGAGFAGIELFKVDDVPFLALVVGGVLLFAVVIVIQLWSQLALVYALLHREQKMGMGQALRAAWPNVPSFLWINVLMLWVVLGGLALFLIPGILFSVWFLFSIFAFVLENARGMRALYVSKAYVQGRWWGVVGRLLCIVGLAALGGLIASVPATFGGVPFVGEIANVVFGILLMPLFAAYVFALYESARAVRGPVSDVPTRGQVARFVLVGVLGSAAFAAIAYEFFTIASL
ncbi:MAG: hypothetical protein HY536_02235 [Candidatus Colwellbacteria bacterium]|nr:hypothetical protein [Candidatus Colwellbacteria bacterium]